MSLLDLIDEKRPEILRLAAKHGGRDLRLFGSVARGDEREGSDVDLLADIDPNQPHKPWTFPEWELAGELEQLLGVHVDVVSKPHPLIEGQLLADAIPLEAADFREQAVIQSQRPRPPLDRNKFHLQRMREAAADVVEFTAVDRGVLDADKMRQGAAVAALIRVGQCTRALSWEFRAAQPEIDWKGLVDFRNIAVHDYYNLDWDKIWKITQADMPRLMAFLEEVI